MAVPLEKERNCKQDYRRNSGCHHVDFFLSVVVDNLMLDETPSYLLASSEGFVGDLTAQRLGWLRKR